MRWRRTRCLGGRLSRGLLRPALTRIRRRVDLPISMPSRSFSNSLRCVWFAPFDVYLLPDKPILREHVRWLRFDDNIIEIDRGLEVLKIQRNQLVSFQLKDIEDDYKRKRERILQNHCETRSSGDERLLRVFGLKPLLSYLG